MATVHPTRRRSVQASALGIFLSSESSLPVGYHRLLDSPEISACINVIAGIISSATIYLMQNTKKGDVRVRSALSRCIDVDPWPGMATRQSWMSWIVSTMLGDGDGNAFVLPTYSGENFKAFIPMPGAVIEDIPEEHSYRVLWEGKRYAPDEVLHFRLFPDPDRPWRGRGYRIPAMSLAASMKQTAALKDALSSPDYKPPLIVSVNTDSDLSDEEARTRFREAYLEDTAAGKPWIVPAELMKITQVKPLSLTDLAVKDTVEMDKRTAASIFNIPPFYLGVGSFDVCANENFIRTCIIPIVTGIEQQLTLKTLISDKLYWQFNRRRLFAYDLQSLITMDLAMSDRGYMTGDEVREDAFRDPAGLTEFRPLENYIPYDLAGQQTKLRPTEKEEDHAEA